MKLQNLDLEGTCLIVSWRDGSAAAKYVLEGEEDEGDEESAVEGEGRKKKGHLARERVDGLQ